MRYPLSGLIGNPADLKKTEEHNAQYPDYDENVRLLNRNVVAWLTSFIVVDGKKMPTNVRHKYETCLDAPNYTVFSNTTSAQQWNFDDGDPSVVPLESPHNDIHLSVGGFDVPGQGDFSPIPDANGDMGENDTAGLDPIFYFHHCFVDRVFWLWQQRHGATDSLEVIEGYPGTNSVDSQGPTPGVAPNSWLTLETPLNPFKRADGNSFTSLDCINIEKQLGYSYGPGSLEAHPELTEAAVTPTAPGFGIKKIRIFGINRGAIRGSFLVSAFATIDGKRQHLGTESVLSRWNVQGCANCQTHLDVKAQIALHAPREKFLDEVEVEVEVRTRDGLLDAPQNAVLPILQKKPYRVQVL